MNFTTFKLAQRDLLRYPDDALNAMANYYGIHGDSKRDIVNALIEAIYSHQYSQMPTDAQAFKKVGLTKEEYRQLDILMKDIASALGAHKVRYWMDGGTMLGSIRHRGMIPWDDDVDFGVLDKDEKRLHKALKTLEGKYDIDWDLETNPVCRRVIISVKSESEFPFAEFFIYTLKKGRTHFRCAEDEDSWGKKCYHEIKNLFPLRDYPYGKNMIKGANNPIPYFNHCYGPDWDDIAYRQQSHKGGFFYDEDRRVKVTKFDHVGSKNDDHVYDPDTRGWVKKGSAAHKKLIKKGYYTAGSVKPTFNLKE